MTQEEENELRAQLGHLYRVASQTSMPRLLRCRICLVPDLIQLQRLKKRKLQLRDRITFIEDQLTPDIIA